MEQQFPGGSKTRVNLAGERVASGKPTLDDFLVIDNWRAAHKAVINNFQSILRGRTRGTNIIVAQRHKRKNTIFDKLKRYPKMKLSRMDDIAGCRLIFTDINELNIFRNEFLNANFDHVLKTSCDKYNYIKNPKETGYRGIHDVYEYKVGSENSKFLNGLLIEVQYRTKIQHVWATTVEVIGNITSSQPKFQKGDESLVKVMALASEILARTFEKTVGHFSDFSNKDVVDKFLKLNEETNIMAILKSVHKANAFADDKENVILTIVQNGGLEIFSFENDDEALERLFEIEKLMPENDTVLIKASSNRETKLAYRNYFSDVNEFIDNIENGLKFLMQ